MNEVCSPEVCSQPAVFGNVKKITRKQMAAVEALIATWSNEAAARLAKVGYKTLLRWKKKDPVFIAVYDAALRAEHDLSMALVRNEAPAAAMTLAKTVHDSREKPATRLLAADLIVDHARDAIEMADFAAEVAELERSDAASGKSPIAGHGSKFPHISKKAIAALITAPNVAEAARAVRISPQTLRRRMTDPAFLAELWAGANDVFGSAMEVIRRAEKPAIRLIRNYSNDMSIPGATRVKAAHRILRLDKQEALKSLAARVAAVDSNHPIAMNSEYRKSWKVIGKKLYEKVQRIKALLSPADWPASLCIIFGHAVDGRAAGTSAMGKDGRQVWLKAPDGCRDGEPVPDSGPA